MREKCALNAKMKNEDEDKKIKERKRVRKRQKFEIWFDTQSVVFQGEKEWERNQRKTQIRLSWICFDFPPPERKRHWRNKKFLQGFKPFSNKSNREQQKKKVESKRGENTRARKRKKRKKKNSHISCLPLLCFFSMNSNWKGVWKFRLKIKNRKIEKRRKKETERALRYKKRLEIRERAREEKNESKWVQTWVKLGYNIMINKWEIRESSREKRGRERKKKEQWSTKFVSNLKNLPRTEDVEMIMR